MVRYKNKKLNVFPEESNWVKIAEEDNLFILRERRSFFWRGKGEEKLKTLNHALNQNQNKML